MAGGGVLEWGGFLKFIVCQFSRLVAFARVLKLQNCCRICQQKQAVSRRLGRIAYTIDAAQA